MAMFYYFSILFFIFDGGHFYDCTIGMNAGFTKYSRSEALNGRICLPEYVVLDAESVTTRVKCALLCSKTELCIGIFYRPEDDKCTGCSCYLNTTTLAQAGTEYYGRKGYKVIVEKLSWNQAKENCAARGGHLASINSFQEQQLVDQILDNLSNGADFNVWIGGNDVATEGIFLWEDGTAFSDTSFSNWNTNQPDNYQSNQDCTRLYNIDGKWGWDDENCDFKYIGLCEFN